MTAIREQAEAILRKVLAFAAVQPATQTALQALPWRPAVVLGGGKAGRVMAEVVAKAFPEVPGALAVPANHAGRVGNLDLLPADHPLPGERSVAAVARQEALLNETPGPCLFLLSGGATAMLGAPLDPLSLPRLRETYRALLHAGLDVHAMNVVRRHLTQWGGGKFLHAAGARPVHALLVSDVLDDDKSVIGSGPTVADPSTRQEAAAIVEKLSDFSDVVTFLEEAAPETVKSGDDLLEQAESCIVLSNQTVVKALAESLGAMILPPQTADVGKVAAMWEEVLQGPSGIYVAGGEPTVTIPSGSTGRGGRNQQLVAELAARKPRGEWLFLSIATDGVDGNSAHAGAWVGSSIARRALDVGMYLTAFDTAAWCEREGLAFTTGPTGTNVADVQVAVVR